MLILVLRMRVLIFSSIHSGAQLDPARKTLTNNPCLQQLLSTDQSDFGMSKTEVACRCSRGIEIRFTRWPSLLPVAF